MTDSKTCASSSVSPGKPSTLGSPERSQTPWRSFPAVTNVVGSSISREADQVAYTWAGPEIAVASTKAYTTQLVTLLLLSLYMGRLNGNLP